MFMMLGMVICTHYLARVYSKPTQDHFLQTFTSFRKCHFKDLVRLDKSFLDGTKDSKYTSGPQKSETETFGIVGQFHRFEENT